MLERATASLLDGRDLFARTSGDDDSDVAVATIAIERVIKDGPAYNPTALILVPTRDQAIQLHETVFQLSSRGEKANALGVFEGKPLTSQIGPLKHGVDIVVGTPARVLEHVKRKTLRIEQLKILVLVRVDEMLDQRLGRELEGIIRETPTKSRQTVIVTGTTPQSVLSMARDHLRDPLLIGVEPDAIETPASSDGPAPSLTNLHFNAGKGAGVTSRDLLGAVTNEGGLNRDQVGAIKIKQNFSLVAVPGSRAEEIVKKMRSSRIKGRKVMVRLERFGSKRPQPGVDPGV